MPRTIRIIGFACLLLWMSGCSPSSQPLPSDDRATPPAVDVSLPPADTTVADAPPTATPPAAPTATPAPAFTIALPSSDAATNAALRGLIEGTTLEGATLGVAEDAATSNGQLRWAAPGGENALLERHVVPVVPFATVSDEI
ncbi:MAG: hypothetical protein KDD73_14195, partial [Anaerolineales bacterium]|nr:hypothetical protein [Anaerolineales bacterium]